MTESFTTHKDQIKYVVACGGWLGIREADETLNDYGYLQRISIRRVMENLQLARKFKSWGLIP